MVGAGARRVSGYFWLPGGVGRGLGASRLSMGSKRLGTWCSVGVCGWTGTCTIEATGAMCSADMVLEP